MLLPFLSALALFGRCRNDGSAGLSADRQESVPMDHAMATGRCEFCSLFSGLGQSSFCKLRKFLDEEFFF